MEKENKKNNNVISFDTFTQELNASSSLGVYDIIARQAGAGTLVPITGFANAVSSAAIEFKTEGFVLGVGAKMFTIAGPVIVYGVSASVLYGAALMLLQKAG